jgi:hypothetical protein
MPVSTAIKFEKIEKKEFDPIPSNVYQVQIGDITEKYKAPWGSPQGSDATEQYLNFEFVILNEGPYKGRKLWKDVRPVAPTPSEDAKFKPSWLWRIISAVTGHPLSFSDGVNWGIEETNALIGRQLRLIVNQTPPNSQGKSYNNITDVLPVEAEMQPLLADNIQEQGEKPVAELSGYDKAKAVAQSLPQAPIQETQEINIEEIPF